jgi:oxalate decarboxylase/phosphoglucose isomerase-like protein (cupin superfamily)
MSQQNGTTTVGGSYKVVDSSSFTVSTKIAAAEVTVEPGAIRELHVRLLSLSTLSGFLIWLWL